MLLESKSESERNNVKLLWEKKKSYWIENIGRRNNNKHLWRM